MAADRVCVLVMLLGKSLEVKMHRQSDLNVRIVPGIRLVALLTLVMVSACAAPSTTPAATAIPTTPVADVPTEAAATPTATAIAPTDTAVTPTVPATTVAPTETPAASARYQLTFEATWSDGTHPLEFPPNPHFSGLIGASHSP
jgi:hypothetical protein